MARTKINDIAAGADLEKIDVKPRQKTGLHNRGRAFLSQSPNPALNEAAEAGVSELTVSTDDCRLWEYNDRIYDGLSMENCKSLVDDIQINSQLQPVIARHDPEGKKASSYSDGCVRDYESVRGPRLRAQQEGSREPGA